MTSVLESVSHAYEIFVEDPVEIDKLKRLHTEYIKTLSIRKTHLIELYTTELYTIVNTFLREKDTLQYYILQFPQNTTNKRLSILNLFQSVSYNYLNTLNYIDETNVQSIKKVSINPTIYTDVIYPLLESSIDNKEDRIQALYYFRTLMSYYFLELNTILYRSPKIRSMIRVYRGEKDGSYIKNNSSNIQLKGITSTSFDKNIAEQYINQLHPSKSAFLEISIHPECSYLYVDAISNVKGEEEILLSPFTRFTITNQYVRESDGLCFFSLYATPIDNPSFKLQDIDYNDIQLNTNMPDFLNTMNGGRSSLRTRKTRRINKTNTTPIFKAVKAYNGHKMLISTSTPFQERMSIPLSIHSVPLTVEKEKQIDNLIKMYQIVEAGLSTLR